jgi:hypothetical protein
VSAQPTDEGSRRRSRLTSPSTPHPTPCAGHPLPQGERDREAYFASSYVADTSIRTFSSPAETGLLSAISRLAMAYIGIGGGEGV